MTIARHYIMQAKPEERTALENALATLADKVRHLPGCEGVETAQDLSDPCRFLFIEKWADVESHKASGALLPKEVLAPVMGALAAAPEGSYFAFLPLA